MKHASLILCLFLTCCFVISGCNSREEKIGVVDVARIINESSEGKKAGAELDALLKEKQADITSRASAIDKLKASLEKEPVSTRKAKEDELTRMAADYQKAAAASQAEIQKKAGDLRSSLIKEIMNIVEAIGAEENYVVILTSENAPYFRKTIDLSERVIKKYNDLQGPK